VRARLHAADDPRARSLWDAFLAGAPDASFFATPRYADLARSAYGTPTRLVVVEDGEGPCLVAPARELRARGLRRDLVSPGRGLPGALLKRPGLAAGALDAALHAIARLPRTALRLTLDPRDALAIGASPERSLRLGRVHVLDLAPGFTALWRERVSGKVRNQCRKADRAGVHVAEETGARAFQAFATLHRAASGQWGADAREPVALFEGLALASRDRRAGLSLVLARDGGAGGPVVAGALLARRGDTVHYWLGAMDRAARALCPSVAVQRFAIDRACATGARRYVLGASGGIASLEAFKASLGAEAIEFGFEIEVRGRLRELARRIRRVVQGGRDSFTRG
jgi:CelD/BcsL family acetyltransferase involved in cellulose biosynthesis